MRRGNRTRYTKDAIQFTLANVSNPFGKEWVAREAAWKLRLYLQQSVFSNLKKWMGRWGIVEGQEEIATVTPPLRLALSRHPLTRSS